MTTYYVYLLKCWRTHEDMRRQRPLYGHAIYTGYTNNIFRRLKEHIKEQSKFTKQFHGNIELGYLEAYDDKGVALRREAELKNKLKKWFGETQERYYSRDDKVDLIAQFEDERSEELEFIMQKVRTLL